MGIVCMAAWLSCAAVTFAAAGAPLEPFQPDGHTLLLYHFDEGQGPVAHDSSGHGNDGEIRGAEWVEGRFGKALSFDGVDNCVFRKATPALEGLRQLTVECWFKQDNPEGRQFLLGKDVAFHFDLNDGLGSTLSLYNRGGSIPNAEGRPHQQVGTALGHRLQLQLGGQAIQIDPNLHESRFERRGEELLYIVRGNGFLHHMVRNIIGYGLPTRAGTAKAHGEAPGEVERKQLDELGLRVISVNEN